MQFCPSSCWVYQHMDTQPPCSAIPQGSRAQVLPPLREWLLPNTLVTVHPLGPSGEPLRAGVGTRAASSAFTGAVRSSHGNKHVPARAEPCSSAPRGWANWGLAGGKRHQAGVATVNGVQAGFNKQILLRPFLCMALLQAWVCFTHEQC